MSTIRQSNDTREVSQFIIPTPKIHEEGVKTQHWQLKDMLKLHNDLLIFPQSHKVYTYDYKNKVKTPIDP